MLPHPRHIPFLARVVLLCLGSLGAGLLPAAVRAQEAAASPPANLLQSDNNEAIASLFYSDNEIKRIHQAINAYLGRKSGKVDIADFSPDEYYDQTNEIKEIRTQGRYFTYPQFYLESLVFRSDIDWTIWLNGQKITPDNALNNGQVEVVNISKNSAEFVWEPRYMEKVNEVWNKWPNEQVVVDTLEGTVSFALHPNQTFSSYVMRILEGKVLPVTVDNQALEDSLPVPPPASTTQPAETANAPSEPVPNPKEIIGLYENTE